MTVLVLPRVTAPCLIFIFGCVLHFNTVTGASSNYWTDLNRVTVLDNKIHPRIFHNRSDFPKIKEAPKNEYNLPYKHFEDNNAYPHQNRRQHESKTGYSALHDSKVLPLRHPKQFHYWNGGYYKTHQRGSVDLPYNGATVRVSATRGGRKAYRGTITSRIITPEELQKHNNRYRVENNEHYPRDEPAKVATSCVMCPEERTLITNWKKDKVILPSPKIKSCDGKFLDSAYEFKSLFGPKPGEILHAGNHILLGKIYYNGNAIQSCQLKVNVIVRKCQEFQIPLNLAADCDAENIWGSTCTFSCKNLGERLRGTTSIQCDENLKWSGKVPECIRTSSCIMPESPLNGKILCNTPDVEDRRNLNMGELPEGTKCRIQCDPGYRLVRRNFSIASCQSGYWSKNLQARCRRKSHNVIKEK